MSSTSRRSFISLKAALIVGLIAIAFHPSFASAQSFCGPNTVVNFNSSNGAYPGAGVFFDSQARLG